MQENCFKSLNVSESVSLCPNLKSSRAELDEICVFAQFILGNSLTSAGKQDRDQGLIRGGREP